MDENKSDKMTYIHQDFIRLPSESNPEGDIHYSILYEGLPEEYRMMAKRTLNETEVNKQKGLVALRSFANEQQLPCTDKDIITVLRCNKYNIKKAQAKLKKFVQTRQNISELLRNVDAEKISMILDDTCIGLFPYRDKHGSAVCFSRPNIHLDLYTLEELKTVTLAMILYIASIPLTTVAGLAYIAETKCDYALLYGITKLYPSFAKCAFDLPVRFRRIDIMNENFLCRWTYNIMRPIFPDKITKRIFFNSDRYEALQFAYHPDILFEEFGGNLGPSTNKLYKERLLNFIMKLRSQSINKER